MNGGGRGFDQGFSDVLCPVLHGTNWLYRGYRNIEMFARPLFSSMVNKSHVRLTADPDASIPIGSISFSCNDVLRMNNLYTILIIHTDSILLSFMAI